MSTQDSDTETDWSSEHDDHEYQMDPRDTLFVDDWLFDEVADDELTVWAPSLDEVDE